MKLIAVKCPQCQATIDIDEKRKSCFCSYCGTKIILDDGSRTYAHVYIDRTREREIEYEKSRYEAEMKRQDERAKYERLSVVFLCLAAVLILITFLIVKSDFDITFNFVLMMIGSLTAFGRVWNKKTVLGTYFGSIVMMLACLGFIFMRTDFDNTFTLTLALPICLHIFAGFVSKG